MGNNIQVGQTFYLFNKDRRDKEKDKEVFVTKVGKKYFYVNEIKFDIQTKVHINTPYSSRYILYKSKEDCEYIRETERRRLEIANRLYLFLTREEVNEIYNNIINRNEQTERNKREAGV